MKNMKRWRTWHAAALVAAISLMILCTGEAATGANESAKTTILVQFKGTQSDSRVVGQRRAERSVTYASTHIFEEKAGAYHVRSFMATAPDARATDAGKSASVATLRELTGYKALGGVVEKAGKSVEDPASLPVNYHLNTMGFQELVFLPDRDYKVGEAFETTVEARMGTYTVSYEVVKSRRFKGEKCLSIKRTVTMTTPKGRVPLSIPTWEESILYAPKIKIVLARKLHLIMTSQHQKQEISFDVKAVKVKKLSGKQLEKKLSQWNRAKALAEAIRTINPEKIKAACEHVGVRSDYAGLVGTAEKLLENLVARRKMVEGLAVHPVPEMGTRYTLYVPPGYDPEKANALVVALHGAGGKARPMAQSWMPYANKNNTVVVAPKSVGRTWTGSDLKRIMYVVSEVQDVYNIPQKHTALFGFSAGSGIAYFAHFAADKPFGALIITAGHLGLARLRDEISGNMEKYGERIKDVPIYILIGAKDSGVRGARADKNLFEKNGARVRYVEVPGMGHTLNRSAIPPIGEWLKTVFATTTEQPKKE